MDETDAKLVGPLKAANLLGHEGFDPDDVQHHLDEYVVEMADTAIALSGGPEDRGDVWLDGEDLERLRGRLRASPTGWA
ncbi:hypothetical protein ACFVAV_33420 [Nocardia sp. NPDC057663]|uniref:hypothetical protein n=1 Tax=Nocardia sp. NPDC057663 TaxID=3346201 RepID=UPI00366D6EC5